jgi:hypothetical protein
VLLSEPIEHVKRNAAAAVQEDYSRRAVEVAPEKAKSLSLLRIMREAVADQEGAGLHAERHAVAT